MTRSPALAILVLFSGCSEMSYMASGDLGITAGGSQDIAYARDIIEAGLIPSAESFSAEGLFSEHDLPVDGADCDEALCPRAAAARIDPVDGSGPQMLVQLGFGTKYSADDFERLPLNLSVAVDISGSMSDGKLDAVKTALHAMVAQLDERDTVSLVAFDDKADLYMSATTMNERGRDRLDGIVDSMKTDGGTSIEAGLELAYDQVTPTAGAVGVEDRVMLFTDAQPNVGATGVHSFVGMVNYFAAADIGVSVFGVGIDMGTELANAISKSRGGNYFFLADDERISSVFDDEFNYIVSPVAYGLAVNVAPADGLVFRGSYGAPIDNTSIQLGAETLFLSSKDGGMGASLAMADGSDLPESGALASFDLSFEPLDGGRVTDTLTVEYAGGTAYSSSSVAADDLGVFKMGVLVDAYLAMSAGSQFCDGTLSLEEAVDQSALAAERIEEVATQLEDEDLADLATLITLLSANIGGGLDLCAVDDYYYY